MPSIKVLGTGCPKCTKLEENVRQAIEKAGITDAVMEKVTGLDEIMKFGVMTTPALVVDGVIKVMGRVPGVDELAALLIAEK